MLAATLARQNEATHNKFAPLDHVQPPMHLACVREAAILPALQKLARRGDQLLRVGTDYVCGLRCTSSCASEPVSRTSGVATMFMQSCFDRPSVSRQLLWE
eukprot:15126018-Alexandrium_andersonii.AAC.1